MFTPEEITEAQKIFDAYEEVHEKLESFCRPIAQALNYDSVEEVSISCRQVNFKCHWQGSYGAEDWEWFSFPVNRLSEEPAAVATTLVEERKEKQKREEECKKLEREEERRKQYLELKKQFEV